MSKRSVVRKRRREAEAARFALHRHVYELAGGVLGVFLVKMAEALASKIDAAAQTDPQTKEA